MTEKQKTFQPIGDTPAGVSTEVFCLLVNSENDGRLSVTVELCG